MTKELNNFTHCSKLDLIKMYKKSRRDVRRLSRQKVELKQQIEKMKCCENCKHKKSEVDRCELLMYTMNACLCKNKDKWEINEK